MGWRDGSEVGSTGCSSRGREFDSQQPRGGSQPLVMRSGALFWYVGIAWRQNIVYIINKPLKKKKKKVKIFLDYMISLGPAWATWDSVSTKQNSKPKTLFTILESDANRKSYLVILLSSHFHCLQCSVYPFTIMHLTKSLPKLKFIFSYFYTNGCV